MDADLTFVNILHIIVYIVNISAWVKFFVHPLVYAFPLFIYESADYSFMKMWKEGDGGGCFL
jgi:hypothetical protein